MKWIFVGTNSKREEQFLCLDDDKFYLFENSVLNITRDGYAKTQRSQQFIHRILLGLNKDSKTSVIFLNGNRLDCRMENIMSKHHYMDTINKNENNGIYFDGKKWISKIYSNKITTYLGSFDTEAEARAAYAGACRVLKESISSKKIPEIVEPNYDEKREAIAYRWYLLKKLHEESREALLKKNRKPITNENGETFNSAYEAAQFYKRSPSTLRNHLNGYTKTAWGLKWSYL